MRITWTEAMIDACGFKRADGRKRHVLGHRNGGGWCYHAVLLTAISSQIRAELPRERR